MVRERWEVSGGWARESAQEGNGDEGYEAREQQGGGQRRNLALAVGEDDRVTVVEHRRQAAAGAEVVVF